MKKLLAVGVVAFGTFGLLMMRGTKSAVAAPQGRPANVRRCNSFNAFRCRVSPAVSIISRRFRNAGC